MRVIALFTILLLVGCGGADVNSDNNHGFGFEFDAQGESGMKLRSSPHNVQPTEFSTVEYYEGQFTELLKCTGLDAPVPPFVILDEVLDRELFGKDPSGVTLAGWAFVDPPLIVLDFRYGYLFKHEALHYLLDYTTGNSDPNHSSPLFSLCTI